MLAPRGSYPATFMLGEAVQAGALAVYVYEAHMIRGKRLGGKRVKGGFRRAPAANETHLTHAAIEAQLPYYNLGLRWGDVGAVATDDEIEARAGAARGARRVRRSAAAPDDGVGPAAVYGERRAPLSCRASRRRARGGRDS